MIIGLDVGGTHTDAVLLGQEGLVRQAKIQTNVENLFSCVLASLNQITEGISPQQIHRIVLSTTLTTNAVVQQKMLPVGMIVSCGPGMDVFSFKTNEHYYRVDGSIDHRGREIEAINIDMAEEIGEKLEKEGIRYIGIVSKFSVRNPQHEIKLYKLLEHRFEKIFLGHLCAGSLNFPRRIATTYINASVYPLHRKFFNAVRNSLHEKGLTIPIDILKADGGTMRLSTSLDFPAQTILSGPAASAMGVLATTPSSAEKIIAVDIGGTTSDIALIINNSPVLEPVGISIASHKTLIRALETKSLGLGGDSWIQVINGQLQIGPERKGPAMAFGGTAPTPTDAMHVLGLMTTGNRQLALQGIHEIATCIGKSDLETAQEIMELNCSLLLDEIRSFIDKINLKPVYTVRELLEDHRIFPQKIILIGGPAPYIAEILRKQQSFFTIEVGNQHQTLNAIGAAVARTTCNVFLFVDTQLGIAIAPEEDFQQTIDETFTIEDALACAISLIKKKALFMGAQEDIEIDVLEKNQFNIVRNFHTVGKTYRIHVQIRPGLLENYDSILEK